MECFDVLVVEDDLPNREIVEISLRHLGHRVTLCDHGAEALRLCLDEGQRYDAILMDLVMPVMGGIETIHRLREHARMLPVPIIVVSVMAREHDAQLKPYCEGFVQKPYRHRQLIETFQQVMRLRSARSN